MTLGQLAASAGISQRTARYYQELGLLRRSGVRGRSLSYDQSDLDRLSHLLALRQRGIPLAVIAQQDAPGHEQAAVAAAAIGHAGPEDAAAAHSAGPEVGRTERRIHGVVRTAWERLLLAPGLELHIARPAGRAQQQAIERVVALFREE